MDCNKEEALRAKEIAEKKIESHDFAGARRLILKAQELYPGLENVPQMLAVCDVHSVAQRKVDGSDTDWYGILQMEPTADDVSIKKQYRKFALLLHPDKNKFCGAEAAFKLVGDAMAVLSNQMKRKLHDIKRRATIIKNATTKSSRFQSDPSNGHFGMKQSNRQSGIHVRMQTNSRINVRVETHSGIRVSVQTKSEGFSKQGTTPYRGKGSTTPFIPVHPTDKGSGTPSNRGHQFGANTRPQPNSATHQQGYRGKGSTTPFIPVHQTDKGSSTPSNPGHQSGANARVQTQPTSATPSSLVHQMDKGSGTPSSPVPLADKGSSPIIMKMVVDIIITVIGFIIMGIPFMVLNCVFYAIFKRIL